MAQVTGVICQVVLVKFTEFLLDGNQHQIGKSGSEAEGLNKTLHKENGRFHCETIMHKAEGSAQSSM
ncbi:unnamed protein product [Arctia plantaginis]|uniref:Uncharacterized protein n=1 Tax=Arctia plantaginis TaxID=874455 RepID=A0A8S0ZZR0_ARCPL|nr:unnamed protein product [Arctia plantaginis]